MLFRSVISISSSSGKKGALNSPHLHHDLNKNIIGRQFDDPRSSLSSDEQFFENPDEKIASSCSSSNNVVGATILTTSISPTKDEIIQSDITNSDHSLIGLNWVIKVIQSEERYHVGRKIN